MNLINRLFKSKTKEETKGSETSDQSSSEEKQRAKLMQNEEFARAEKELTKRFGRKAALNDVKWRVYNQRIIEYASKRQWGLYRNNKLDMAMVLKKEGRDKQALSTLFEVCCLDLNGCQNAVLDLRGRSMPNGQPNQLGIKDFDPATAFLAPGVIAMIKRLMSKAKITVSEAKKLFIETNEKTKPMKEMPVSTEAAWKKLASELS